MTTEYITNTHGIKFYIEGAADFTDRGHYTSGKGWFAGLVKGNAELGGVWFETRAQALDAIHAWKGEAA